MKSIIRIIGLADGRTSDIDGAWLAAYDNTLEDEHGVGTVHATREMDRAMRFHDFKDAWEFWKQGSLTIPRRPDGKPNRPLTAFTVTIENVER